MPLTPEQELERIDHLHENVGRLDHIIQDVRGLERRTVFVTQADIERGYYPIQALEGYEYLVRSFQALDTNLTPQTDQQIDRATGILEEIRKSHAYLGPKPTEERKDYYVQEKMRQLAATGETYMASGHDRHFNITRIRALPEGGHSYTLYDSGHETRVIRMEGDRAIANAVEERRILPSTDIAALIRADIDKKASSHGSVDYNLNKGYIEAATEPTPIRTVEDYAQRRGNCTTRGQRILMEDIITDRAAVGRMYDFMTDERITPQTIQSQLDVRADHIVRGREASTTALKQAAWEPYKSSALGQSMRYDGNFVTQGTPDGNFVQTRAMQEFQTRLADKHINVQWGFKANDGKAYAFVPESDQVGTLVLKREMGFQIGKTPRGNVDHALVAVHDDLRAAIGNDIIAVTRGENGFRVEVPGTFSRSLLAGAGVVEAGQLHREGSSANTPEAARGNHVITIPDANLPPATAHDVRVLNSFEQTGFADQFLSVERVRGRNGQTEKLTLQVIDSMSPQLLIDNGIDARNLEQQRIGSGVRRLFLPVDAIPDATRGVHNQKTILQFGDDQTTQLRSTPPSEQGRSQQERPRHQQQQDLPQEPVRQQQQQQQQARFRQGQETAEPYRPLGGVDIDDALAAAKKQAQRSGNPVAMAFNNDIITVHGDSDLGAMGRDFALQSVHKQFPIVMDPENPRSAMIDTSAMTERERRVVPQQLERAGIQVFEPQDRPGKFVVQHPEAVAFARAQAPLLSRAEAIEKMRQEFAAPAEAAPAAAPKVNPMEQAPIGSHGVTQTGEGVARGYGALNAQIRANDGAGMSVGAEMRAMGGAEPATLIRASTAPMAQQTPPTVQQNQQQQQQQQQRDRTSPPVPEERGFRTELQWRDGEKPVMLPNGQPMSPVEAVARGYGPMVETVTIAPEAAARPKPVSLTLNPPADMSHNTPHVMQASWTPGEHGTLSTALAENASANIKTIRELQGLGMEVQLNTENRTLVVAGEHAQQLAAMPIQVTPAPVAAAPAPAAPAAPTPVAAALQAPEVHGAPAAHASTPQVAAAALGGAAVAVEAASHGQASHAGSGVAHGGLNAQAGHALAYATIAVNGVAAVKAASQGDVGGALQYGRSAAVAGVMEAAQHKEVVEGAVKVGVIAAEKVGLHGVAAGVKMVGGKIPVIGAVVGLGFGVAEVGTEMWKMGHGESNWQKVAGATASAVAGTAGGIIGFGAGEALQEGVHYGSAYMFGNDNAARHSATVEVGTMAASLAAGRDVKMVEMKNDGQALNDLKKLGGGVAQGARKLADVNRDGHVDAKDAMGAAAVAFAPLTLAAKAGDIAVHSKPVQQAMQTAKAMGAAAAEHSPVVRAFKAADVNHDGHVDAKDAHVVKAAVSKEVGHAVQAVGNVAKAAVKAHEVVGHAALDAAKNVGHALVNNHVMADVGHKLGNLVPHLPNFGGEHKGAAR